MSALFPPGYVDARARYRAFMDEHVYPNEAAIGREDDDAMALVEISGLLFLLLVALLGGGVWIARAAPVGTGFYAKQLCSAVFLAGRAPEEVVAHDLAGALPAGGSEEEDIALLVSGDQTVTRVIRTVCGSPNSSRIPSVL